MEKQFIPYEQAIKLKQLGFDEKCFSHWAYSSLKRSHYLSSEWLPTTGKIILAPLWQQAFDWFREEHNLIGHVRESWSFDNILEYVSQINGTYVNHGISDKPVNRFETYQETQLACLDKLIEIVENK